MKDLFDILLKEKNVLSILKTGEDIYLLSQLDKNVLVRKDVKERIRLAYLFTSALYSENGWREEELVDLANKTYTLLKSININSGDERIIFDSIVGVDGLEVETLYYFILSSVALKSDKVISIRLDLQDYYRNPTQIDSWKHRVINNTLNAFILLVRKSNAFKDINDSLLIINDLQKEQSQFEAKYLENVNASKEIDEALELLGFYHISKTIVETAKYLIEGYNYKDRLENIIRQHIDAAKKLLISEPRYQSIASILEDSLKNIQNNSIWSKTNFNDKIQKLCRIKSQTGFIELLPSQREALSRNLLDVASNVTVLQMPTSAGKTLLAEFNILVTKALKQDSKIIYVVPSRALVNQIYHDLREDLEPLDLKIEKTSSAIEVDPSENHFLTEKIDILVSTPEKLDLLIRRDHVSVQDVSLFIIDEAHTIQNGHRGAKLELLLAILKRERPFSKFMLLSPFIGDSGEVLKDWLGGGNSIVINWKPSEKIVVGLTTGRRDGKEVFKYTVLPSPYGLVSSETHFSVQNPYPLISTSKKDRILEYTAKHFSQDNKTVLFLCAGKGSADTRAQFLYNSLNEISSDEIDLIRKYITDEVGRETVLSNVLSKKIAVHHAGLSDEVKILVEYLIRKREIKYVCSTTTVAEGVNFPVSAVFFDSFWKRDKKIDHTDFWNIAGRAGRTLIDNFGKIILPFNSKENIANSNELLKASSIELVSVLSQLFIDADVILERIRRANFSLNNLISDYYESLSPLVQYFVHLITVSDNKTYVSEIEDLFKDSLEYYILDTKEKKEKFISICREIYNHLQERYKDDKGLLSFADKTGFSVPSVLSVMMEKSRNPTISNLNGWEPEVMFSTSNIQNLTEKVRVIAALKETRIGTDSQQAPFEPEHIARILISWVKGAKYESLSMIHPSFAKEADSDKRLNDFVSKMNDIRFKASWGLSALEGIVRNDKEIKDSFIPSLVYYGVDNEKSLILRMVGVPRLLSFSMSKIIDKPINKYNFSEIRKIIKGLTNPDWDSIKPKNSALSGMEWKRISEILVS